MRIATWLIVIACVGHLVGYTQAVPEHIADEHWPGHARFHVLQALVWLVGLDLLAIVIAVGPFARGLAWSRWALLLALVCSHGAYFIALTAFPDSGPPQGMASHGPLAGAMALHALGLVIGWRRRGAHLGEG